MSHFTVLLPASEASTPGPLKRVVEILRGLLGEPDATLHELEGARLLVAGTGLGGTRLQRAGEGWVVVTGRLIDLGTDDGELDAAALLELLAAGGEEGLQRYEGTFALAAWHTAARTGWVLNDQASMLSCYYGEFEGGLYASTAALPLAQALGLELEPQAVCEMFARGTVLAPTTMFRGLRRLDLGEHVRYHRGTAQVGRHWLPYRSPRSHRSTDAAAESLTQLALERIRRLAPAGTPVICDLTGGYDSRLVVSAAHAADRLTSVTVDGPEEHDDVVFAKLLAQAMGWEIEHFDPRTFWDRPITPEMRRELTYRTNGELPFTEVYHHLLSRPLLAQRFRLHLTGGGGELMRAFPWSQEFLGIGRRRTANVDNLLRYRFFQEGPPRSGLFRHDWHPALVARFRERAGAIFALGPGSLTTQQLDAAYLWRMTGFSPYTSAVSPWLSSVPPLMCAGIVDAAIELPWRMRLTSKLVRSMTYRMSPRLADLPTRYGGTAGPTRATNLHRQVWQLVKQSAHLARKIDRVRFGGRLSRLLPGDEQPAVRKPYLTDEFRSFLNPRTMRSRGRPFASLSHTNLMLMAESIWPARGPPRENVLLRSSPIRSKTAWARS